MQLKPGNKEENEVITMNSFNVKIQTINSNIQTPTKITKLIFSKILVYHLAKA